MLYLLHGKSEKRKEYIKNIATKLSLIPQHIYDNDVQNTEIENLVSVQTGLFGDKEIYVLHSVARVLDIKNILAGYSESENIFIFSEDTITKPITKEFEKYTSNIHDFGKEEKSNERKLPVFNLADELGRRDKKNLWLLFQELAGKVSAEEIHGILFWGIKNMMLVKTSPTNPGLAPFVYTKTKKYADNYSVEELQNLSRNFTHIFHTRDTYNTLDIDIEKIILSL
jgi:hypothetical protein